MDVLAYERIGRGEPVVLVHGIGHRRQAWRPVVEQLAAQREVILVDLHGHGQSPPYVSGGRAPKDVLSEVIVDFFDALHLDRPHIAGNSLGGLIALEAAKLDIVRSATAIAPAGFWRDERDFAYVQRLFGSIVAAAGPGRPLAPALSRTIPGRALMFSWLTARPERIPYRTAVGDFRAMLHARPALREILAGGYPFEPGIPSGVPVTIAWGRQDRVLRPYQARRARRLLPDATHLWLDRCGHVPMTDDPRLVADVILAGSRPVDLLQAAAG